MISTRIEHSNTILFKTIKNFMSLLFTQKFHNENQTNKRIKSAIFKEIKKMLLFKK